MLLVLGMILSGVHSPCIRANHDNLDGMRIGEASNPGPAGPPHTVVSHFDDPDGDDTWPEEPPHDFPEEVRQTSTATSRNHSDSEASTAAPPSDEAGCTDDNVVAPWDMGLVMQL